MCTKQVVMPKLTVPLAGFQRAYFFQGGNCVSRFSINHQVTDEVQPAETGALSFFSSPADAESVALSSKH